MIRTLTAHTMEIDDEEAAVTEILDQLDLDHQLLKNSVGIISCHLDYMEDEIVKIISEKLPFDVVGINTISSATAGEADQMLLALTVLTSDDVSFAAGLSDPLGKGKEGLIGKLFEKTSKALAGKPSMALVFSPLLLDLGGDVLVNQLDAASGGIPLFGTLAIGMTLKMSEARINFNGDVWNDRLGIILLSGNFEPRFSVTSISENKILKQKVIVTKSRDNVIEEMNDMPVGAFFETMGLAENGKISTITIAHVPLILDYNDNADPVARSIMAQSPEGCLICGGDIPQDCSVGVGSLDTAEVLKTTGQAVKALVESGQDGLLLFSCAARNFALGLDSMAEIGVIREGLGPDRSYMLAYSGGEICPVKTHDGKLKNRFHNATFVSCSFK